MSLTWVLEDLNTDMIHSRKLGVQAIVTLQVRIEAVRETEAAADVKAEGDTGVSPEHPLAFAEGETSGLLRTPGTGSDPVPVETLKRRITAASMAVRGKDTYGSGRK